LLRLTWSQRWVHRGVATLMGLCLLTAAVLYIGPLSVLVGERALVERIHVYAGIGLPVPVLLGLLSRSFRADLPLLNRFLPVDWLWLKSASRRSGLLPVGKFNAGQKINAAFVAGSILVMLGTGLVMRYANHWSVSYRSGATFVHDWLAYAIVAMVAGHLYFATRDPMARRGMRTGIVATTWARREHKAWAQDSATAAELRAAAPATAPLPRRRGDISD
jgi:formate dehydrogenase subunit gamma